MLQPPALLDKVTAFPSLHVCWTLLPMVAPMRQICMVAVGLVARLTPVAMGSAIVAAANQYILDAVAAAVPAAVALLVAHRRCEDDARMTRGSVVVSVHDVAPSTFDQVRAVLGTLDAVGARPRVLKVIPHEPGARDLRNHPQLLRLLAREAAAGSEIVLHGYTHRASGPLRGPWPARLRGRLFAGSAAEFLTLDPSEMVDRLAAGRALLRGAGLEVEGFCAPGWLAGPGMLDALRRTGFRRYVAMAEARDLASGRRVRLPWYGYMGAGPVQERLVGLGGRILLGLGRWWPAVKVFIHPQGAPESAAYRRTVDRLARLLRERRPVTYAELLTSRL